MIRSHIVEGVQTIGKIPSVQPLGTPGTLVRNEYGEYLIYRSTDAGPTIDDRNIIEQDGVTRNGFLHVIDRPLLPKRESLVDRMRRTGEFDTFLALCRQAGLYDLLGQFNTKVTVFAPVDAVFEADGVKQLVVQLRKPENVERLRGILLRHFVEGQAIFTTNSISFRRFQSSLKARLDLERDKDERTVQDVDIVMTDLLARNGVAHGINGIISGDMEMVDLDQNWKTYRNYVNETLARGGQLYSDGELSRATDYYARRNYEFTARYGSELKRLYGIDVKLNNDLRRNFRYDFATTAWSQRERISNRCCETSNVSSRC